MKNEELVSNFKYHQQEGLCGNIGTRRVKLFLNTKIKEGDKVANAYRLALEAEHKNIDAKNSYGKYKDKIYEQKRLVIDELISLCLENDFVCGYQDSNVRDTNFIIYFELPDMRQISFHSDIPNELFSKMKEYEKDWDGEVNSTIAKIECAIEKRYHDELVQYNEKVEIGAKKREEAKSDLAPLGRYVCSPKIFDIIENLKPGANGEYQFTDALDIIARSEGALAYVFDGTRYDMGDRFGYLKANIEYGLRDEELKGKLREYLKELVKD